MLTGTIKTNQFICFYSKFLQINLQGVLSASSVYIDTGILQIYAQRDIYKMLQTQRPGEARAVT